MKKIVIDGPDQILYQWDKGQRLLLHGAESGTRVDFVLCGQNKAVSKYAYSEAGAVFCDIPDSLLMDPNHLHGYVYEIDGDRGETVREFIIPVIRRPMPEDYVEPEEVPMWHELQQQIDELKKNGVGGGTTDAVQYIAQKLTEDQQMQARRNLGLYGKRTELSKTEVYRYFYVGWWEGSGTLTEIPNGRSYLISVLDAEYACTSYSKTHTWSEQTTGYIGNVELIPEDVRSAYSFDESCSVDCPVVLYQVNSGSLTVVIDPDLTVPVAGGATFYELGNPVEVVDTIPEEYLPEGYGSGGYYTPSVSQPTEDTMQMDFTPSSEDMPAVEPVTVTLPVGPAGEPGDDGLTPYIGANGNWWIGDTDTGVSASASGGVVVQDEEPEDTDVLWIDPDDDDEPEETDTGTDKSLGITGAEVGQTVRITEVDANGVPTAWEAVNVGEPSDEQVAAALNAYLTENPVESKSEWRLLRTVTLPDDPSLDTSDVEYTMCSSDGYTDQIAWFAFNTDDNGEAFAVRELFIRATTGYGRAGNYFGVADQNGSLGYGNLFCNRTVLAANANLELIVIYIRTLGTWAHGLISKANNYYGNSTGNALSRKDEDITTIKYGTFTDCSIAPGSTFEFWGR